MGRVFTLWAAFLSTVVVIVVAFGQSNSDPAESAATVDESRPASVATPTSDARMNEAGQQFTPQAPVGSPQPGGTPMGETVSPSEEAEAAEEALIPAEPARKLWRFTPLFSGRRCLRRQYRIFQHESRSGCYLDHFRRIGL